MSAGVFYIKRGDISPSLVYRLRPTLDLTGATAVFNMRLPGSVTPTVNRRAVTIQDVEGGVLRYDWQGSDTALAGRYEAEFEVQLPGGLITTFPNLGFISVIVSPDIA